MRIQFIRFVQVTLCAAALAICQPQKSVAQDASDQRESEAQEDVAEVEQTELAAELNKRMKKDQEARFALLALMQKGGGSLANIQEDEEASAILRRLKEVDTENREWLKQVIKEHGWPGKTLVGTAAAHAAWLLVQHSDDEPEFQRKCLAMMTEAGTNEVTGVDIAYLTDRVLAAEGKPQRYGTQVVQEEGEFVVKEVEDPKNLNDRRKEVGLPPIEEYLELVKSMYAGQQAATDGDAAKDDKDKEDDDDKGDGDKGDGDQDEDKVDDRGAGDGVH